MTFTGPDERTDRQVDQLIRDHWWITETEPRRHQHAGSALFDDLQSAACLALWECARRWSGEGSFQGYALPRVRWRIIDAVRQAQGDTRKGRKKPKAVSIDLLADHGEELRDWAAISPDEVDDQDHYEYVVGELRLAAATQWSTTALEALEDLLRGERQVTTANRLGLTPARVSQAIASLRPAARHALTA